MVLRSVRSLGCVTLSLACFGVLFGDPMFAQEPPPPKAAGGALTIDVAALQKPWTGDLDGMIERRVIRVLTVTSKTFYFNERTMIESTPDCTARTSEDPGVGGSILSLPTNFSSAFSARPSHLPIS